LKARYGWGFVELPAPSSSPYSFSSPCRSNPRPRFGVCKSEQVVLKERPAQWDSSRALYFSGSLTRQKPLSASCEDFQGPGSSFQKALLDDWWSDQILVWNDCSNQLQSRVWIQAFCLLMLLHKVITSHRFTELDKNCFNHSPDGT
jgi:hypothetical protein